MFTFPLNSGFMISLFESYKKCNDDDVYVCVCVYKIHFKTLII